MEIKPVEVAASLQNLWPQRSVESRLPPFKKNVHALSFWEFMKLSKSFHAEKRASCHLISCQRSTDIEKKYS